MGLDIIKEDLRYTSCSDLGKPRRGKVRDVYDLGDSLLIVTTDRLSAFDKVLLDSIPGRGAVLTKLSFFWFRMMEDIVKNHLSGDSSRFAKIMADHPELVGRSMLVKKAVPLKIEAIVRGYLSGSGWKEYKNSKSVCGIKLPSGLQESDQLPEPIFTPSTKAEAGHDINISFDETSKIVGTGTASKARDKSLAIYARARDYAKERGIIVADTKFEFGLFNGELILIDEILTPDSSRFWSVDNYKPGRSQDSFDKQIVRDYLLSIGWSGQEGEIPKLPKEIIDKTRARYIEALTILTR